MNTLKSKFEGIDANNETSLLEYGLLVYSDKHEDGSGTQFCVYKIQDNQFGCGHFSEEEINKMLSGEDWINEEDLKSFYSYVGADKDEYLQSSFTHKLYDLISYFGTDNICGSDYSPMTEEEVKERYL